MNTQTQSSFRKPLLIAIALIFLCVLGFHLLLPILGIAIAISAAAWGMIVASIVIFSIAALLLFAIPGFLVFLVLLVTLGWLVLAIVLFPIIFPIIIPIFIILAFIGYLRKKKGAL